MLIARAVTALVACALAGPRARRRLEAREAEAGHVAALAQRWSRTPAVLGGPILPGEDFGAVTFDTLGLTRDACHADVRQTAAGTYRLVCAGPGPELSAHAERFGAEAPAGGGLLIVGTRDAPEEAVAVLVLGPLVQVCLPDVPWEWIRRLTTPETDPLAAPAQPATPEPEPRHEAPRRASDLPQRTRRMPSWRSSKPATRRRDREMAG